MSREEIQMTPYQKAEELLIRMSAQVYKYQPCPETASKEVICEAGKKCALIAVNTIINEYNEEIMESNDLSRLEYWENVRDVINDI